MLWRIDPATNEATRLPNTRGAEWPAVGEDAVWVTDCEAADNPCVHPSVLKLDPSTGATLASIRLPGYGEQITTGLGSVWVSTSAGLVKIDALSAKVAATFPLKATLVGTAAGSVWASGHWSRFPGVAKVDPRTGKVDHVVRVHDPCTFLATDHGIWVASCQGGLGGAGPDHLTKLDPVTGKVAYRIPLDHWGELAFAAGYLWMSRSLDNGRVEVDQRDPTTGLPTGVVVSVSPGEHPWEDFGIGGPAIFTAVGDGSFWLTHVDADAVVRVPIPTSS